MIVVSAIDAHVAVSADHVRTAHVLPPAAIEGTLDVAAAATESDHAGAIGAHRLDFALAARAPADRVPAFVADRRHLTARIHSGRRAPPRCHRSRASALIAFHDRAIRASGPRDSALAASRLSGARRMLFVGVRRVAGTSAGAIARAGPPGSVRRLAASSGSAVLRFRFVRRGVGCRFGARRPGTRSAVTPRAAVGLSATVRRLIRGARSCRPVRRWATPSRSVVRPDRRSVVRLVRRICGCRRVRRGSAPLAPLSRRTAFSSRIARRTRARRSAARWAGLGPASIRVVAALRVPVGLAARRALVARRLWRQDWLGRSGLLFALLCRGVRSHQQQEKNNQNQSSCKSEIAARGIHDISHLDSLACREIFGARIRFNLPCRRASSLDAGLIAIRRPSQAIEPLGFNAKGNAGVFRNADGSEIPSRRDSRDLRHVGLFFALRGIVLSRG